MAWGTHRHNIDDLETVMFCLVCIYTPCLSAYCPIHAHGVGVGGRWRPRGPPGAEGSVPARILPSLPIAQLTYIFRRLGNFLKIPVASRTDISLSFSRLHGKRADEGVA